LGGSEENMLLRAQAIKTTLAGRLSTILLSGLPEEVSYMKQLHYDLILGYNAEPRMKSWDSLSTITIDISREVQISTISVTDTYFCIPTGNTHARRLHKIWKLYITPHYPKAKLITIPSGEKDGPQESILLFMCSLGKIGIQITSWMAKHHQTKNKKTE